MSTLFSSLQTASTALQVFSRALGAEQTNVSNASTPGFAAIRAAILPIGLGGSGSSSDFVQLTSAGDARTDAAVQAASSQASSSQTAASQLAPVNQLFDITGSSGILAALRQFGAAFSSLSVTPNDQTLRSTALSAAGNVASAFNKVAASLDSQTTDVDGQIASTTAQINHLATQIRQYNIQARTDSSPDSGAATGLRSALDQLSSLVDIGVTQNPDGTVSVLAGGQQPLVLGDQAFTLSANPKAAPGSQIVSSGGGGSPATYSGQLGALLQVRNGSLAQLLGGAGTPGSLNTLAKGFATRVNTLLTSGVDSNGSPGVALFTFDGTNDSNVARTLAVDPSVTPDQLGLATGGSSAQSNGIANQLSGLTSSNLPADQIGGLSPEGLFASIAAGVGQQLSDAQDQSATDQTALTSVQADRQQESGVSLDQEAVAITALQRAYEASAKVVSIIDQLTSDEVNLIK
jgi:flagellar hook-associated protein 1 FlgK